MWQKAEGLSTGSKTRSLVQRVVWEARFLEGTLSFWQSRWKNNAVRALDQELEIGAFILFLLPAYCVILAE